MKISFYLLMLFFFYLSFLHCQEILRQSVFHVFGCCLSNRLYLHLIPDEIIERLKEYAKNIR